MELLLIRWIPANVKFIGFFANFLLIASFLGIGLGILLGRHGANPRLSPFAFLLAAVVAIVYFFQLNIQVRSTDEIFFGLAESNTADLNFLVLPLVVALVVAVLATLALPLGPLLKSMRPLRAYAIDIIGSLSGIASFAVLSALGTEPLVWFGVTLVLVVALDIGRGLSRWTLVNGAMLAVIVVLVFSQAQVQRNETWSPYYRIDWWYDSTGKQHLNVDGIPHQALHRADDPRKEEFYEQVYEWFPERTFDRVLIIGAGSGTDVAVALRHGAGHVDAVEIDPELLRIGRESHPNQPYSDPRVAAHVNDGRNFLGSAADDTKWDLIVFALPDSLTLVSSQSALRLESFLFTEQAFSEVRDHLTEDGVFVLYNYYRDEWLVNKLATMLGNAFDHEPLLRTYAQHKATIAAGPLVAQLNGGAPPGDSRDAVPAVEPPAPAHATDDWPFLYLRVPHVPAHYLGALGVVLLGALLAVAGAARVTGTTIRRFSPHFFVLGVAFLLLTTRSLVSFSLLFGTTWVVNAMAFFAILASVLLAIFVNARWPIRRPTLFYLLLFASIAVAFLLPPDALLFDPPWLRYLVAAAIAFAPVFFANLVFSYSFRDTATADMAFASNLLGAMVGGAIEYLALITGYGSLLLVVALLYGLAWLFATRLRLGPDTELASSGAHAEPAL